MLRIRFSGTQSSILIRTASLRSLLWPLMAGLLLLSAVVGCSLSGESEVVTEEQGRPVAEKFLELIRGGKAEDAWDSTTAEFKSAEGRESFIRSLKGRKFLSESLTFDSVQTADMNGTKRNEFRFNSKDGHTVTVIVGPENDEWKVDWLKIE